MRRIGLYSLIAFASLALIGVLAVGVGSALNSGDEYTRVAQATTPTVSEPPAPETVPEETEEEQTEEEQTEEETTQEEKTEEQEAAQQEEDWREIAEQRGAEQRATEQRATEQRATEQRAAEQAQPSIPTSTALSLTVPSAGIQNDPVTNSVAESVLANGAGKIPSTGFPWQAGANTYIAGHVYGYPGTGSWQQFAQVPNMSMGDAIYLTDSSGTVYEYRVNEILRVAPTDVWVAQPTGQNIVSLQTCVGPGWSERLVVRGALVGTSQA